MQSASALRGELIPAPDSESRGKDLEGLLPRFFLTKTSIRSERTQIKYVRAVRWFGEMLKRPATTDDLSDELIGALAKWLKTTRNQCPRTSNSSLESLCCLWKWAASKRLAEGWPTIQAEKTPQREPKAFTQGEFQKLVEAARRARGSIGGLPASVFWLMAFQLVLNTGARASELLAFRWEWIEWETGWLRVPAEVRKGGRKDAVYALWPETLAFLDKHKEPQGVILDGDGRGVHFFYYEWKKLLVDAGMPNSRYTKTQCLRRTFATVIDLNGGNASEALGHDNPALAARFYLDRTFKPVGRHADVIPDDFRPLALIDHDAPEEAPANERKNAVRIGRKGRTA